MNCSASERVKTLSVALIERTQLAPTALAHSRHPLSSAPASNPVMNPASKASPRAGAPPILDVVRSGAQPLVSRQQHTPIAAASDHDGTRAGVRETLGLGDRIGQPRERRGLVGVGQKDVGLCQHRLELAPMIARPGHDDIEHRRHTGGASRAKQRGQRLAFECRHEQIAADIKQLRRPHALQRNIGRAQGASAPPVRG